MSQNKRQMNMALKVDTLIEKDPKIISHDKKRFLKKEFTLTDQSPILKKEPLQKILVIQDQLASDPSVKETSVNFSGNSAMKITNIFQNVTNSNVMNLNNLRNSRTSTATPKKIQQNHGRSSTNHQTPSHIEDRRSKKQPSSQKFNFSETMANQARRQNRRIIVLGNMDKQSIQQASQPQTIIHQHQKQQNDSNTFQIRISVEDDESDGDEAEKQRAFGEYISYVKRNNDKNSGFQSFQPFSHNTESQQLMSHKGSSIADWKEKNQRTQQNWMTTTYVGSQATTSPGGGAKVSRFLSSSVQRPKSMQGTNRRNLQAKTSQNLGSSSSVNKKISMTLKNQTEYPQFKAIPTMKTLHSHQPQNQAQQFQDQFAQKHNTFSRNSIADFPKSLPSQEVKQINTKITVTQHEQYNDYMNLIFGPQTIKSLNKAHSRNNFSKTSKLKNYAEIRNKDELKKNLNASIVKKREREASLGQNAGVDHPTFKEQSALKNIQNQKMVKYLQLRSRKKTYGLSSGSQMSQNTIQGQTTFQTQDQSAFNSGYAKSRIENYQLDDVKNAKSMFISNRIDLRRSKESKKEKATRGGTMMADYPRSKERTDEISFNNSLVFQTQNGLKNQTQTSTGRILDVRSSLNSTLRQKQHQQRKVAIDSSLEVTQQRQREDGSRETNEYLEPHQIQRKDITLRLKNQNKSFNSIKQNFIKRFTTNDPKPQTCTMAAQKLKKQFQNRMYLENPLDDPTLRNSPDFQSKSITFQEVEIGSHSRNNSKIMSKRESAMRQTSRLASNYINESRMVSAMESEFGTAKKSKEPPSEADNPRIRSKKYIENVYKKLVKYQKDLQGDYDEFMRTDLHDIVADDTLEAEMGLEQLMEMQRKLEQEFDGGVTKRLSPRTQEQVKELIVFLDQLIIAHEQDRIQELDKIRGWKPDTSHHGVHMKAAYSKFTKVFKKKEVMAAAVKTQEAKERFEAIFADGDFVRDVLMNDPEFTEQMAQANEPMKKYINGLLSQIPEMTTDKIINHDKYLSQKDLMKKGVLELFAKQRVMDKNRQTIAPLDFKNMFLSIPKDTSGDTTGVKNTFTNRSSGLTTNREFQPLEKIMHMWKARNKLARPSQLQYLVQKYLVTGFPHSMRKVPLRPVGGKSQRGAHSGGMDFLLVARLAMLNTALDASFPNQSDVGDIYNKVGINLFENAHFQLQEQKRQEFRQSIKQKFERVDRQGEQIYSSFLTSPEATNRGALSIEEDAESGNQVNFNTQQIIQKAQPLQSLFGKELQKDLFFKQAKLNKLTDDALLSPTQVAMQRYYDVCQQENVIAQPSPISFTNGLLFLMEQRLSEEQAATIRQYLETTRDVKEKQVTTLIVDGCLMKDEIFAAVLKGIMAQAEEWLPIQTFGAKDSGARAEVRLVPRLKQLCYSNSTLGNESLPFIAKMLPYLEELQLNNIQSTLNQSVIRTISTGLASSARNLQKLRLSNVNLNDEKIVQNIIEVIQLDKQLHAIDLSRSCLSPKLMLLLSEELKQNPYVIKNLNLSYNSLSHDRDRNSQDWRDSEAFVNNMIEYLKVTDILNHINLSGMNLNSKHLLDLAAQLCSCPNLLAIHLSDNGIIRDQELMIDILDYFGLGGVEPGNLSRALKEGGRPPTDDEQLERCLSDSHTHRSNSPRQGYDTHEEECWHARFQKPSHRLTTQEVSEMIDATSMDITRKQLEKYNPEEHIKEQFGRKLYKDFILQGKQQRQIKQAQLINKAKNCQGVGRREDSGVDPFVLTRKVNHSELIFNQDPLKDQFPSQRYFEQNAAEHWRLSQKNECYVCERYQYTMIFFEKGILSTNEGLDEIKDKRFLKRLKEEYEEDPSNLNVVTPQIRGSVVEGNDHEHPYQRMSYGRTLRMLRADIFTILALSQSVHFVKKRTSSKAIQNGFLRCLEQDTIKHLEQVGILTKLQGWHGVLNDMCYNNELHDVNIVNQFDLRSLDSGKQKNLNVYAGFLPPGRHKFLIYCPQSERAFTKSFLVQLDTKEFCPEFPRQVNAGMRSKTVQNVWRPWLEDTPDMQSMAFSRDASSENFQPELIIKDAAEITKLTESMLHNFGIIQVTYLEKLSASEKYPEVDWIQAASLHADIESQNNEAKEILMKSQLELCFIRATRNFHVKGLKGSLPRSAYLDFLVRLSQQAFPKKPVSEAFIKFTSLYLKPIHDKSKIIIDRKAIRGSKKLNELLFDNRNGLKDLFEFWKDPKIGFTVDRAIKMLKCVTDAQLEGKYKVRGLDLDKILACFVYSMMTILDEIKQKRKYHTLKHIEFLDFLCRVAINCVAIQEPLEYKVHHLLEIIYKSMTSLSEEALKKGGASKSTFESLRPVAEEDND